MKYDNNQYYYSPSKNYPWYLEDNKPDDAIPMTVEMEEFYEIGKKKGFIIQPNPDYKPNSTLYPFIMVHPDTLLSEEDLLVRDRQLKISQATTLLNQSIKLESRAYQRNWATDQITEFEAWQDELYDIVHNNSNAATPETPSFIQEIL